METSILPLNNHIAPRPKYVICPRNWLGLVELVIPSKLVISFSREANFFYSVEDPNKNYASSTFIYRGLCGYYPGTAPVTF